MTSNWRSIYGVILKSRGLLIHEAPYLKIRYATACQRKFQPSMSMEYSIGLYSFLNLTNMSVAAGFGRMTNRAMMYWHIFEAICDEIGEERAVAIMKKAVYNRGLSIGKRLASYAPDDFKGLRDAFIQDLHPDGIKTTT